MQRKGILIVISAASGTGKTSLRRRLLETLSNTARSISAFSAPTTRNTTRSAASSTGSVKVMRCALSFPTIGVLAHRDVCRVTRVPGKSDAVWPSTPMPRKIKWNRGNPRSSHSKYFRRTSSYSCAARPMFAFSASMRCTFACGIGTRISSSRRAIP